VRFFEGRDKVTVWALHELIAHLETTNVGVKVQYHNVEREEGDQSVQAPQA
jgi:ABC-type lipopolysaccharide export system ATPase subunit